MIWLFKVLLFGHIHKWKIIKERVLGKENSSALGQRYVLQCEKCGDVCKRDLI